MWKHAEMVECIKLLVGKNDSASSHLSQCMYTVAIGTRDYINNYYVAAENPVSQIFTPDQFADLLVRDLRANHEVSSQ